MRMPRRVRADVVVALALVAPTAACVEPFRGSNVQMDFAMGVQTNARPGATPQPDQPPGDTHYELYAADLVYQTNPDGSVVIDASGQPKIDRTYLFKVKEFKIRPAIDTSSPCFIDLADTRFPGIHVTQYAAAVRAATGITDPFASGQDREDVIDVLTADRRHDNLDAIEATLKAVTSHANFRYPATSGACAGATGDDPQLIPPPTCFDEASNARRLALCQALWDQHPGFYEGSDKVFTLPLSGQFFGMVEGMNPVNNGFVGGSSFFVEDNLITAEAFLLNWQYDDLDNDGAPDFPPSLPVAERSATGFPYLAGEPERLVRGVLSVPMVHASNPRLSANVAIFYDLDDDDVHF